MVLSDISSVTETKTGSCIAHVWTARQNIRSVFMLQDHFGYNSVQLGITW